MDKSLTSVLHYRHCEPEESNFGVSLGGIAPVDALENSNGLSGTLAQVQMSKEPSQSGHVRTPL